MNALSFDGFGLNDTSDKYRPRIATFIDPESAAYYGALLEAAPEMADALKAAEGALSSILDGNEKPDKDALRAICDFARNTLNRAGQL